MAKYKLSFNRQSLNLDILDAEDVEFYNTYSFVRQINEDEENPEYETLMEIDHHNDESNLNKHGLNNDDIDRIVDIVFSANDLRSLISELRTNEQELIYRFIEENKVLHEKLLSINEEKTKNAEEIYNNTKANFNNLMENSINLSAFDTNESTINCTVSAALKYTYTWKNIYNPGTNSESTEFNTYDYVFSFTSGQIIKNQNITWEDVLKNEEKYEDWNDWPERYKNEISNYYSTLDNFYEIRATGKMTLTEYDGWEGIEEDGSQGEDAEVFERNCFYNSYETDYRFSHDYGKFKQKFIDNCYLRLSTLKDTEFYDELKEIEAATINGHSFKYNRSMDKVSFCLNTYFKATPIVNSYFENKKFKLLHNIKTTKNLNVENIFEIFNTNNYIKNSISDENPFGSFKFNGKIYNLKICDKNYDFNNLKNNRFPSYRLEQIEDEIRFIEEDPNFNLSEWPTTYYDVYKLTLEYGLNSFFNLLLNFIFARGSALLKVLAMIGSKYSPNLRLSNNIITQGNRKELTIGYMLEELFNNSGDSLKAMMNVLSYTYIIKGNDYKEEFNMRVDDPTVGVPCDYIEERSIEWK